MDGQSGDWCGLSGQHEFPEEALAFHCTVGIDGLIQGENSVNYRFNLPLVQHCNDLTHVFLGSHVDSEYMQPFGEQDAHMKLSSISGGNAADAVTSTRSERTISGLKEFSSHMIYHYIYALVIAKFLNPLSNVFRSVIDYVVCPEYTSLVCLFLAASGGDNFGTNHSLANLNGRCSHTR